MLNESDLSTEEIDSSLKFLQRLVPKVGIILYTFVPHGLQITRNAFSVHDHRLKIVGVGIYPFAHLFNHS